MDRIERFYATIERKPVDRPASWLGFPVEQSYEGLFKYFNVNSVDELKVAIDDDVYAIDIPYSSPISDRISTALDFRKGNVVHTGKRTIFESTLTAPGFFEDYSDPARVEDFDWPDPSKYISREECKRIVENVPNGYPVMAVAWSCHYENTCAAFGMETALVKMLTEPEMFKAVSDRILKFYMDANEIFYSATKGKVNAVLIGNDLGSQTGLMISPKLVREFVLPGTKKLVEQAKSYGLKVFHHSCGSIYEIIPDLIEAGVDVIHPIQALAYGMDPYKLKKDFGDKVSFCGGVDAQFLLVNGKPEEIREKVIELKNIYPTGLIISPSHEAILPDVDPRNIQALFEAIK